MGVKIKAFANGLLLFVWKISIEEINIVTYQTFTQPMFDMSVTH